MKYLQLLVVCFFLISCGAEKGVSDFIDQDEFDELFANANSFYSYSAFIEASKDFPEFVGEGNNKKRALELAAFLANISHETTGGWADAPGGSEKWGLYYLEEIDCKSSGCSQYCDVNSGISCAAGKSYHGRGPIQLSYNYNYNSAGLALGVDLLNQPELVTSDSVISFKTALWFWMNGIAGNANTPHEAIMSGDGFGETIRIINSIECNGGAPAAIDDRVNFFKFFTGFLGVKSGKGLRC